MAVTLDSVGPSSSGHTQTSGFASGSWSHTISGSATALLAAIAIDGVAPTYPTVAVTAGAASMTQLSGSPVGNNSQAALYAFGLLNPPTGSVTISFTVTGTLTSADALIGGSLSFLGAGAFGTPVTVADQTGSSASATVTGTAATSLVAGFLDAGDAISAPTSGTSRWIGNVLGSSGDTGPNGAGATIPGSGTVSLTWSGFSSGDTHCTLGVEVLAASNPGPLPGQQMAARQPALIPVRRGWRNAAHSR